MLVTKVQAPEFNPQHLRKGERAACTKLSSDKCPLCHTCLSSIIINKLKKNTADLTNTFETEPTCILLCLERPTLYPHNQRCVPVCLPALWVFAIYSGGFSHFTESCSVSIRPFGSRFTTLQVKQNLRSDLQSLRVEADLVNTRRL